MRKRYKNRCAKRLTEKKILITIQAYQAADHDLRQRLPTLIALIFSLTPYILEAQVEIQNRMLAHYYTVLLTYCEEEGFPSPPAAMDKVVQDWEFAFKPTQAEIENFGSLAQGKAMRRATVGQENKKRPSIGNRIHSTASSTSLSASFRRGSQTPGSSSQTPCVPESPPLPTPVNHWPQEQRNSCGKHHRIRAPLDG